MLPYSLVCYSVLGTFVPLHPSSARQSHHGAHSSVIQLSELLLFSIEHIPYYSVHFVTKSYTRGYRSGAWDRRSPPSLPRFDLQSISRQLDRVSISSYNKVVEEELVRRMASKWEKVVDKAASKALGRKLIICG